MWYGFFFADISEHFGVSAFSGALWQLPQVGTTSSLPAFLRVVARGTSDVAVLRVWEHDRGLLRLAPGDRDRLRRFLGGLGDHHRRDAEDEDGDGERHEQFLHRALLPFSSWSREPPRPISAR